VSTAALSPELFAELADRATRDDFPKLEKQLRSTGYCARPVRLKGHTEVSGDDGRWRSAWSTATEPDGVLRKACGNRREAVCPACAERYRQDAYHLIAAGLRGGKGIPDSVSGHPLAFVTLTAPSFGAVHTRPTSPDGTPRRCRPRRDAPTCPRTKGEAKLVLDEELRKARLGPLYRPDVTVQQLVDAFLDQYQGAPSSKDRLDQYLGEGDGALRRRAGR
jgi:hypothetical protein